MPYMTPDQAKQARRATLQAVVDIAAVCTTRDPDEFFREDGEAQITWQARRAEALWVCTGCPARAACEELALRDGDGRATADDMVRGGRTGPELAETRAREAARLTVEIAADRDTEGKCLDGLISKLQRTAIKNPARAQRLTQAEQNEQIRSLAGQINGIRTARRRRAGWKTAA